MRLYLINILAIFNESFGFGVTVKGVDCRVVEWMKLGT